MRFDRVGASCMGWALILLALVAPGAAFAATPAQVDAAIDKAKAFLYSQQKPDGRWEGAATRIGMAHDGEHMQGDTFGGFTAMATYALLAGGESQQNPRMVSAIQFLENADIIGIYALGMRANVWPLLPSVDKRAKQMSIHDAVLLAQGLQPGTPPFQSAKGFWDYGYGFGPNPQGRGRADHSVSQYGVLGLWACAQNEAIIDRSIWESIDAGWKAHQYPDGGWTYDASPPRGGTTTASMTAAGVATLYITDDMLNPAQGADCRGNIVNENIELGLKWISDHYKDVNNPYVYYGIERIGAASGRKYFGNIDWYTDGASKLIGSQKPDGSWMGTFPGGDNPVVSTAFALLFLVRGREPVMINKLEYTMAAGAGSQPIPGNWNQRPRDIANLTRWTGYQMEHGLNWQIVNLSAPLEDMHDAPVLYISGNQALNFAPADEAKLREFMETGGMILANSDCGASKTAFAKSVEALGQRLFPKYMFRDLPANHPIFVDQPYHISRWKTPQRLRGLSNGVRELIVLIPDSDPARAWQMRSEKTENSAFELGADVFLYAVDKKNLHNKGEGYIIRPDPAAIADHSAKIARLMVGENPDPEPGGWRRLAALLHNQFDLDIDVMPVALGDKKLASCKIAHLTGTGKFMLTPVQRNQLTDFVEHGGTLIVDAAGGNADFAAAAEYELKMSFGIAANTALQTPLDKGSPVFNIPGARISEVTYRDLYRRQVVGKLRSPHINGIPFGQRIGVFYSREDLSAGLVGEPVDGIAGYSPQSATDLMRNIVLYSAFSRNRHTSK